jgi:orotate phosphoribosyltransferase
VKPAEIELLLETTGAIRHGHFQLSSGLHSGFYCQCALLFEHPRHTEKLAQGLAEKVARLHIDAVAAPALGGIVLGYELARALNARSVFVERDTKGDFALRRFSLGTGEHVLVAEDVLTTGASVQETIEVVRRAGGNVVGVAAIMDRSGGQAKFDVPHFALYTQPIENYPPGDCPLCRQGKPLEKPGSRPANKQL